MQQVVGQLKAKVKSKEAELGRMREVIAQLKEDMELMATENAERMTRAKEREARAEARTAERASEALRVRVRLRVRANPNLNPTPNPNPNPSPLTLAPAKTLTLTGGRLGRLAARGVAPLRHRDGRGGGRRPPVGLRLHLLRARAQERRGDLLGLRLKS